MLVVAWFSFKLSWKFSVGNCVAEGWTLQEFLDLFQTLSQIWKIFKFCEWNWIDLIWFDFAVETLVNNVCKTGSLYSQYFLFWNLFFVYVRYLGNNSLVGPLPAASLGSLVNLQQLWAKKVDSFFINAVSNLGILCVMNNLTLGELSMNNGWSSA